MTSRLITGALLGAVSFAAACRVPEPVPPPAPPRITAFSAAPELIQPGESARLTFSVENAETLELVDQLGAPVTLDGDGADVSPATSTVYLLRATGPGGRDSAFARVQVRERLESVFLLAVPTEVQAGEPVSLVWSAIGGADVQLVDSAGVAVAITGESGVATVTPSRSTTYTLSADPGAGRPRLTRSVAVTVRPVISTFSAAPPAAPVGEHIVLSWQTAGAQQVTLTESTFGTLFTSTAQVAQGQFEFTVPAMLPAPDGGSPVPLTIGYPLSFTLVAATTSPQQQTSRTLGSSVGTGPIITGFSVPRFATQGSMVPLTWTTTAQRVEVFADGQIVYSTSGAPAASSTISLPVPPEPVTYTLAAFDVNGLRVDATRTLTSVRPPVAMTFNVPATVASPAAMAAVSWVTADAATVVVRLKNGPVLMSTTNAAQLAAGSAQLKVARDAVLVLEAINAAGDRSSLEKPLRVVAPLNASVSPDPAALNFDVTFTWDTTSFSPALLEGVPGAPVATPGSGGFVDLESDPAATALVVPDADEAVVAFTPPEGFVFPVPDDAYSTFWASTNGFLAFASTTVPRPVNLDLATTTTVLPAQVAPFWDDLQLGVDSSIRWKVDGAAFPRRLIVQWSNMRANGDAASRLTFQVQLWETGRFGFFYDALVDGAAAQAKGESASIGVFLGAGRFRASHGFNLPVAAEDLELDWFTTTDRAGTLTSRVTKPGGFTPFFRTAAGDRVPVPMHSRVFLASSVQVSEAMPLPAAGVAEGQWAELTNATPDTVDLGGLELSVADAGGPPFVIPGPQVLPAGGRLVLGQTTGLGANGDAPVTVAWGAALTLGANTTLQVRVPDAGAVLSALQWGNLADGGSTPAPGVSISADPRAIRASPGGAVVCNTGSTTYGQAGSTGTPGAANDSCFPYRLTSITPAYEDISTTGTKLFDGATSADFDDKVVNVTLSPAFPYFGSPVTAVSVSTNGFIAMRTTTNAQLNNKSLPSATAPTGTVAPFWDNLNRKATAADGSVYTRRMNGYQVVQWHHYGADETAGVTDDLNFQVKLFDDGKIEFHYAQMRNGGAADTTDGSSATVWLEAPGGYAALPISINQSLPRQNTAWRFTPVP